jgi:branched-chain amino acid transport system substrate-binding protein
VVAAENTDAIVVGVVHSDAYPSAEMMKRSFEMAVEAKNDAGGVKGKPLKLLFADDGVKTSGAIGYQHGKEEQVVESLRDGGAVMLLGGYSSANTIHTALFAEKLDIPLLVTTAADNEITRRKFENVYRLNPPAKEYAGGVEQLLIEKIRPKSMAIVYEASRYGTDTAARMLTFCRENGIKVNKVMPYQKDRVSAAYLEKRLRRIQDSPPDVVYMVSYLDDAVLLVDTLRALNIGSLLIGAGGGFTDSRFIDRLGSSAEGIMTAALWSPRLPYPGATDYYDRYVERYKEAPDYHGAEAYAAVHVAADVLERAESLNPEAIRTALNDTDLETLFGQVRFRSYDDFERQNKTPTVVLKVAGSKFEFVWPENIAAVSLSTP